MKRPATAIAVAALIGTPAFAADMAVKAPPPSPPSAPVYNWTGFYVGGNIGASFGRAKTDFNGTPLFGETLSGPVPFTPGFAGSDTAYPSGFMGGGQIGYNWQYSPLIVVGLEADIQGALERETDNLSPQNFFFQSSTAFGEGTAVTNYTTQIDWFGTVRLRIGYVWGNGEVMSYVTGGLAYGEVKINGTNTVSGEFEFGPVDSLGSVTRAFDHSHVNTGWTVGFGTEGKLLIPGWTYKIESLYMDLGTLDATSVTSASPAVLTGVMGQVTTHTHFTDAILRAGLNYQFH
jgi:outer membrane immunogenic protein